MKVEAQTEDTSLRCQMSYSTNEMKANPTAQVQDDLHTLLAIRKRDFRLSNISKDVYFFHIK